MAYKTYRDLLVWQKAMELVVQIYEATRQFPSEEKFGLVSQMRRAAVSIPSNISEGHGRQGEKEFKNFLWIANGSLMELETQLIISEKLGMINSENSKSLQDIMHEVGRMLTGLRKSLNHST